MKPREMFNTVEHLNKDLESLNFSPFCCEHS